MEQKRVQKQTYTNKANFFTKDQFKEKSNLFNKWWSKWNPYRKK